MIEKWTQLQFEEMGKEISEEFEGDPERPLTAEEMRLRSESARAALEGTAEALKIDGNAMPGWWEDYARLRAYGWPWRVAVYVAWSSIPKERRWPSTQEELATEVLGLNSDRAIYQWRRKNPGIEDAIAVLQSGVFFEHRAGVIEALIESARNPNYKGHQDRKLFFEMIGDYTPRSEENVRVTGVVRDLSELTEAELERLAGGGMEIKGLNREGTKNAFDSAKEEREEGQEINHETHEIHENPGEVGNEGEKEIWDE